MSKTTFEKLGIPYEERDGIFYPVLVAGTEQTDIEAGKYGRMWVKYIKERLLVQILGRTIEKRKQQVGVVGKEL